MVAGQVRDSTWHQYTEDFFDYLAFAKSADAAVDAAIFSQWRDDLVERIYLAPDPQHTGEMRQRQLSPNTINRMLAAVRHMMQLVNSVNVRRFLRRNLGASARNRGIDR